MCDQTTVIVNPPNTAAAPAVHKQPLAIRGLLSQHRWIIGIAMAVIAAWHFTRPANDAAAQPAVQMPTDIESARGMIEQHLGRLTGGGEQRGTAVDPREQRPQQPGRDQQQPAPVQQQQRFQPELQQDWQRQQALEQEWLRQQQEAEMMWMQFVESQQ